MKSQWKYNLTTLLCGMLWASFASAGEMQVQVEIPQLNVSEYHRPYIAVWIQDDKNKVAADLAVWYQLRNARDTSGHKWLPDLRQWWRRSGRSQDLPIDGVSGATKPAGDHTLTFLTTDKPLSKLKSGQYKLLVEASREVGGRELLEVEFEWPAPEEKTFTIKGKKELGTIRLTLKP